MTTKTWTNQVNIVTNIPIGGLTLDPDEQLIAPDTTNNYTNNTSNGTIFVKNTEPSNKLSTGVIVGIVVAGVLC
ncbi:1689_t:CDS:2 [Ambispora gerdemannii]|uniref:1689_t:CDS:1 n=1 Tax=Ambispora gerdemannii TaxID=144530 RepID=A0A9N9FTW7_9GLOM|nr:1689_t:CDS:2 [Ambispora gerdemannii]